MRFLVALIIGMSVIGVHAQESPAKPPAYTSGDRLMADTLLALRAVALRECGALDTMKQYQEQLAKFQSYVKATYHTTVHPQTLALVPPVETPKK